MKEPCGGWVVCRLVDTNHGSLSPCPTPGRSKVKLFGPLPPIDGALSGKTGLHIKLPFFLEGGVVVLSFLGGLSYILRTWAPVPFPKS